MIRIKRKAFTIVELVIVIAVIAILAAILIPTFSNIIKKSQISADESTITNLNKQISIQLVDQKIESGEDLERVIVSAFSQDYYDNLTPKSAEQGYNFWFNIKTKMIELKKYDESFESDVVKLSVNTKSFNSNNFRMFGDYYLLDQGGSNFADAIKALETLTSSDSYMNAITLVNDILSNENNHHYVQANTLINKLSKTVIIGNSGTFRYADYINVTNVLFISDITTINSNLYLYDGTNVITKIPSQTNPIANVSDITLPSTITSVEGNALYFKENKTVNVYGSFTTLEEVKNIFKAYSTNGIIKYEDGLVLDGSGLEDLNGNSQGNLGYSNPVASFDILCEETNKIKYVSGILYVAYDQKEFQLIVDNFIGENPNNNISSEEVSWSSDNSDVLSIDENGKVTIERIPTIEETTEYTLTATAIAGGHVEEIKIVVVKVEGATITIGENGISAENKATLTYNGGSTEYDIVTALTYTYSGIVDLADEIIYETSGNIFEVNDDKLKLKEWSKDTDLTKPQMLTIIIGEYLTIEVEVTIIDNSAKTFETKFTNDYLYRVGNANDIKLSSLFASEKPGDNIILTIYDAAKTSGEGNLGQINTTSGFSAQYESSLTKDNWESSTIKFSGTGVAIVEIKNSRGSCFLTLEVINGTNITGLQNGDKNTISSLGTGNVILLNDVYFSGTSYLTLNNASLYGNGFTLDVTNAAHQNDSTYANIDLMNSNMDNVKVNAAVYPEVGGTQHANYFAAAVRTNGKCTITNSYISNARVALRVDGDTIIKDTILDGGAFANLELRSGNLTLNNITTINGIRTDSYNNGKNVMGFGIVILDLAGDIRINIEGYLKQYNWVGEKTHKKYFSTGLPGTAFGLVFEVGDNNMYYNVDNDKYINTGIVCMSALVSQDSVTNVNGYLKKSISYSGYNGWVMSLDMSNNSNQTFYSEKNNAPKEFINHNSSIYQPSYTFEFNSSNIISDENNETISEYNDGKVIISSKLVSSKNMIKFKVTDLLKVTKYTNQEFSINVKCIGMNTTLLPDNDGYITIENSTSGLKTYTLIYTISDNLFYNKNGSVISNNIEYTYEVPVELNIIKPAQKNAEMSFIEKTSSDTKYKSPSGKTNYYPSAYEGISGPDYYYLAPIFDLNIVDYDENNTKINKELTNYTTIEFIPDSNNKRLGIITVTYDDATRLEIKIISNNFGGAPNTVGIYKYNNTYYYAVGASNLWSNVTMQLEYSYVGLNGQTVQTTGTMNWYGDGTGDKFYHLKTTDWQFSKMSQVDTTK